MDSDNTRLLQHSHSSPEPNDPADHQMMGTREMERERGGGERGRKKKGRGGNNEKREKYGWEGERRGEREEEEKGGKIAYMGERETAREREKRKKRRKRRRDRRGRLWIRWHGHTTWKLATSDTPSADAVPKTSARRLKKRSFLS